MIAFSSLLSLSGLFRQMLGHKSQPTEKFTPICYFLYSFMEGCTEANLMRFRFFIANWLYALVKEKRTEQVSKSMIDIASST